MNNIYNRDMTKRFRKLSNTEQVKYYIAMKNGDMNARNILIESCLPMVVKFAENFHINNKHIDLDDMIQEGNMALMKAVDNWDINKGQLTTIAGSCIKNALINAIQGARYKITNYYSLSAHTNNNLSKIDKLSDKKKKKLRQYKMSRLTGNNAPSILANIKEKNDIEDKYCMLDLHELSEKFLSGIDKRVFDLYTGRNGSRQKVRGICQELNMSEQDVRSVLGRCKRKMKKVAKNVQ